MESAAPRYLRYDELTQVVKRWAEAHPPIVRLESLCTTPGGRELWLLTIGREPDRTRPALWVDANMHAGEVAGSVVALAIAEALIAAHTGAPIDGVPSHLVDLVRQDVLVYVLPRMCPDGAEHVLTTGAYVRSNPRDGRLGRTAPFWRHADVNGDGSARLMRRLDPAGEFVASSEAPEVMLPRRVEDAGPFYALYPEGFIERWDGFTVPADGFLASSETDMNRNFPYNWAPEPDQEGAGAFATSEPEARAVTAFATTHPNIFAWLNLHTFGGCFIRPLGEAVDRKMEPTDLALYLQIGEWTQDIVGYPTVSGFEEFTYQPDKPLRGELSSFAYAQRGAVSIVCELWDFWKQVGLTVHRPFVKNYTHRTREDLVAMARWDREKNQGRIFGAWTPHAHPQIGDVEVGGYDPRFGVWNPPEDHLPDLCRSLTSFALRFASLGPRVRIAELTATSLGDGVTSIAAVIENLGYLPTYVLRSARARPWNQPLIAALAPGEGVTVVASQAQVEVGHLEGWGGYQRSFGPDYARSEASPQRRKVVWVVRGRGTVEIVVQSVRVGAVRASVAVG